MGLPDFIIVGGKKCGSSSLRDTLGANSAITMIKREGNYFNYDGNYNQGVSYYQERLDDQEEILTTGNLFGEKTVEYSFDKKAIERINSDLPNAKFLWILRNPVERFYSDFLHEKKNGNETRSLDEVMSDFIGSEYFVRGLYVNQIEDFHRNIPVDNSFVVLFERFKSADSILLQQIQDFIGLERTDSLEFVTSNQTIMPRWNWLNEFSIRVIKPKSKVIWKLIHLLNFGKKTEGYSVLPTKYKRELSIAYQPYVFALENKLNIKTGWL